MNASTLLPVVSFTSVNPVVTEALKEKGNEVVEVGNLSRWMGWMVGRYIYSHYWKQYLFVESIDEETQVVTETECVPVNWLYEFAWTGWRAHRRSHRTKLAPGDVIMTILPRRIQDIRHSHNALV